MMARNKHPEETYHKILDVSLDLFFTKGFDRTSIQDIIDNLGGLSKGAVYHHFKSKEDILTAVLDRDNARLYDALDAILKDSSKNGAEKFQALLEASITGPQFDIWAGVAPDADPVKNARLLGLEFKSIFDEVVPDFVEPIIREGVEDGSIITDQPREMAEVLVVLANLWAGPMFRPSSPKELLARVEYYIEVASKLGVDFVDTGIIDTLKDHVALYNEQLRSFKEEKKREALSE